jgi:hypothetical protein
LKRANGRLNIDHTISKRLKIGANLSLARSSNRRVPGDNDFTNPLQLNAIPPLHAMYLPDGSPNPNTLYYNNLIDHFHTTRNAVTYRSISSVYGEFTILPSLTFRSQVGVDWLNLQEEEYLGRETLDGRPGGVAFNSQVTSAIVTYTNTLNYRKSFGEDHTFDAVGGIEYQRGDSTGANITGIGFPSNKFKKLPALRTSKQAQLQ